MTLCEGDVGGCGVEAVMVVLEIRYERSVVGRGALMTTQGEENNHTTHGLLGQFGISYESLGCYSYSIRCKPTCS